MFWILGRVFAFWDVFWILASVLDSGTCFVPTSHRKVLRAILSFSKVLLQTVENASKQCRGRESIDAFSMKTETHTFENALVWTEPKT